MEIRDLPFTVVDWKHVPPERHEGDVGFAIWRSFERGNVRVRMVEYSPGYVADHWCERGHVLLVLEGELHTELADGERVVLGAGMSYQVADGASSHRSAAPRGAKLFIVD
jgi:quercetin dioxygenase-like cupin family protein